MYVLFLGQNYSDDTLIWKFVNLLLHNGGLECWILPGSVTLLAIL